jgi:hypothetical protein
MADNKKQPKQQRSRSARKEERSAEPGRNPYLYAAVAAIIIVAVVAFFYAGPALNPSVPFSTFKSGFQSAARVSITATYSNQSQYTSLSPCFTSMIQVIAHSRKASTIDFFIIDRQNSSCVYSTTGLGGSISPATTNSSYCIGIADSEPGIFLNYSAVNSTTTTLSRMFVYGNSEYMASCPIAVELN